MRFKTLSQGGSLPLISLLIFLLLALFFLLPEERDNIISLRNTLLINITLGAGLIILLPTLLAGKFQGIHLNKYDKIIIAFFCWILINESINDPYFILNSEHRTGNFIVLGAVYFTLRFDRGKYIEQACSKFFFPALWSVCILYGLIETCINMVNANTMYFDLFFSNKGRAGLFLLFAALINFSFLKAAISGIHKLKKIISLASVLSGLFLIIISNSRTAWICLIVLSAAYVLFATNIKIQKITTASLILMTLSIVAMLCFWYKADSSLGRGLIWKVSLLNSPGYLFKGFGFDNFGAKYNSWQSDYFSSQRSAGSQEMFVAGNTFTAFNDYLQFAVELGCIPVLLLLILFAWHIFRDSKRIGPSYKLFILAIALSAFTFYPLHQFHLQAIFTIIIAFISNTVGNTIDSKGSPKMKIAILLPFLWLLKPTIAAFFSLKSIPHWQNARANIEFNIENAAKEYEAAFSHLNSEGQFLIEYAYFLSGIKKYRESISISTRSTKYRVYQSTYLNLGHCYEELAQNDLAEKYYLQAIHCIPSRLGPRYKLILLYRKLHRREMMQREALTALSVPLKNPDDQLSQELLLAIKGIYQSNQVK